jgi:hypothetical protein
MPEAELALLFLRPLNRLGMRYVVNGSVASILYGEPRLTNDVDVIVFLREREIIRLAEAFPPPEFYVPPAEVIAVEVMRSAKGQFNVIRGSTGFKADFFTAGRDDLNAWAFRNARKMEFRGEQIVVTPPEYVIVRKLEYFRDGGAEKHVRDIRAMLSISGEGIDPAALNDWIRVRGVEAEWRKVQG